MRVWLVTIGESINILENQNERLHRTGIFAEYLSNNGHKVIWWTSTFDHWKKKHHFKTDYKIVLSNNYIIKLIKGIGYKKNISLQRFVDHKIIARKFAKLIRKEEKPDIIICAYPTIELCEKAIKYGEKNNIPVVIDIRDLWPDIFIAHMHNSLKPIVRFMITQLIRRTEYIFKKASAIFGITEPILNWGLNYGRRSKTNLDNYFYLAYPQAKFSEKELLEAASFWDSLGIKNNPSIFTVIFIGSLGEQFDLETVINAFNIFCKKNANSRLVICGLGKYLEKYQNITRESKNILFSGWINSVQINVLLQRATVGINPLPDRFDFLSTINNKAIEYFSAGLPIISSPSKGLLNEFIIENKCGKSYSNGNISELVDLFSEISNDTNLIGFYSQNAKKIFNLHFSASIVYYKMMKQIETIHRFYYEY